MISQIKNAAMAKHESVELPYSKLREQILKVLEETGFVKGVKVFKESKSKRKGLHIDLVYGLNGKAVVSKIKQVSKPGRRIYATSSNIKKVNPKFGVVIISTSAGIMSGAAARKRKLGGEIICEVK